MTKKEKVQEVLHRLYPLFPNPQTALLHSNPWELLVATILSAQMTDKLVNTVTPDLFAALPTVQDFSRASAEEVDQYLKKVNYHRSKAKHIQAAAVAIVTKFQGEVPQTMEALTSLPGIGRKTANVILGSAFGITEGIVVDTHVIRLTNKLGLTTEKDPVKIEKDLMKIVPREHWTNFSHLLVLTGRTYCPARKHNCSACPLHDLYVQ